MNLIWGRHARRDLNELISHISEESLQAAELVANRIDKAATLLALLPYAGREGRVKGTRELVVMRTPYILVYRIQSAVPEIVRVYHAARRWPSHFD